MKQKILLATTAFLINLSLLAQNKETNYLTIDSLQSGSSKDVLVSFFQLGLKNIFGDNKQFNFAASPFGFVSRANKSVLIDSNFAKYKLLRNTNFNLGLSYEKDNNFSGFHSGLKYAIINKRDTSSSAKYFNDLTNNSMRQAIALLTESVTDYMTTHKNKIINKYGTEHYLKLSENIRNFITEGHPYSTISDSAKTIIAEVLASDFRNEKMKQLAELIKEDEDISLLNVQTNIVNKYQEYLKAAPLLTIGISDTTYKDRFTFSDLLFFTEFNKGIGKPKPGSNVEFNILSALHFSNDSLIQKSNLKRLQWLLTPGINFVVRDRTNAYPFFECKFGGRYTRNLAGLYNQEKKDLIDLTCLLRLRVFNDFWIPLELTYNPSNGRLLGMIDFKFNFFDLSRN